MNEETTSSNTSKTSKNYQQAESLSAIPGGGASETFTNVNYEYTEKYLTKIVETTVNLTAEFTKNVTESALELVDTNTICMVSLGIITKSPKVLNYAAAYSVTNNIIINSPLNKKYDKEYKIKKNCLEKKKTGDR